MELRRKRKSNIYKKFVGCFTKNGKQNTAINIIINSLVNTSKNSKAKAIDTLKYLVSCLGVIIELRYVKSRKKQFTVPVPVNRNRRDYLIVKKMLNAINKSKGHYSLEKKLTTEMKNIVEGKDSYALDQRDEVVEEAVKNKGNLHFRW